jgi:hypothetical protein
MSGHVVWQRLDRPATEFLRWVDVPRLTLRGDVVGDLDGRVGRAQYRVDAGDNGITQAVRIHVDFGSESRHLRLFQNAEGHWLVDGINHPELRGATDIDIGVTPATNTLPIRRFGLGIGESRELVAVWLRFPDLSLWRAHQRYTRMGPHRYRYESLDSGYQADLTVRDDGIVEWYADVWRALG